VTEHVTESAWLACQYGDAERLRRRHEAHARFSENRQPYVDWLLGFLEPQPDLRLLDVGCGHGAYHPRLRQLRMPVVGVDRSPGMLREVQEQARSLGLAVRAVRGDATRLPLADASVERAMANHMLYHVPDQRAALRELRRVLHPEGRLVIGANAADSGRRLTDLHDQAAHFLGYEPLHPPYRRFHLGHLPLVQEVFPEARIKLRSDAFRFPDVDAVLRYYATSLVDHVHPRPADGSHRPRLLQILAPEIRKAIEAEGCFRVAKNAGCFVVAP